MSVFRGGVAQAATAPRAALVQRGPLLLALAVASGAAFGEGALPIRLRLLLAGLAAHRATAPGRLVLVAATGALAASVAAVVWLSRAEVPGRVQYDDASYHLPAVATFRAFGDLSTQKPGFGDPATAFYPIAGELFSFALLAPLSPDDFLARFSELPFALACLLATFAVARRLGVSPPGALAAALLFAATPRVFQDALMTSAGNDLATAFFALSSVLSALELRERPEAGRAAAAGLALGLLAGTKYTGLLFAAPLAVLLASAAASASRERLVGPARAAALLAIAAGVAVATGGYAYLRNLLATGNPVFPGVVRLFGHELFGGLAAADPAAWAGRPEHAIAPFGFLLASSGRLGLLAPYLLLPAALLAPVVALAAGRTGRRVTTALALALPAVLYAQFLFLMLDHRDVRYFLAAPALAAVAAAWLADRARWPLAPLLAAAAVVATLAGWHRPDLSLASHAAVLLAGALAGAAASRLPPPPPRVLAPLAVAALTAVAPAVETFRLGRYAAVPLARELDARTAERGARVATAGGNQPYPFWGSRLQNVVSSAATWREPSATFFTWAGSSRLPREELSFLEWREALRREGVSYLVFERAGAAPEERAWVALDPAEFVLVAREGESELWEVRLAAAPVLPALELRADTAASPLFADGRLGLLAGPPALAVPAAGAAVVFPPAGVEVETVELVPAPGEDLPAGAVRVNGRQASVLSVSSTAVRLGVPEETWSQGPNVVELFPARPVRLSAVTLLGRRDLRARPRWAPDLPFSLDEPADGASVPSTLELRGWCQGWGGTRVGVEEVRIDGAKRSLSGIVRGPRPDVEAAFPGLGSAREAGFSLGVDASGLAPGAHVLVVTFRAADGRVSYALRRFRR